MKPILLRTASTLLLTLLLSSVLAPAAGARAMSQEEPGQVVTSTELDSISGGCRKNCGGGGGGGGGSGGGERRQVGTDWRFVSQVDGQSQQLAYGIVHEYSNVYGTNPINYRFNASDSCRHVFTSGGVGISTGLNVSIGTTYHCSTSLSLDGSVPAGYRVKIYRGDMRMISTITVAEYAVYNDGSSERTGNTDVGRNEKRWYRYTPVMTAGN